MSGVVLEKFEDKSFIEQAAWLFRPETHQIWCCVGMVIACFVIEFILYKKDIIFSGRMRKFKRAKAAGHVVTGVRKDATVNYGEGRDKSFTARYEYKVGDYTGTHIAVFNYGRPPESISLYYDKSPRKVFTSTYAKSSPFMGLFYIIPFIVVYFVVVVLLGWDVESWVGKI